MTDASAGSSPKRTLDVCGALLALLLLSPLLVVAAAACRFLQGRPILHRAQRAGQGERPFTLLKLRTMTDGRDASGALLADADRLTPLGQRLRAVSIDELPQLWNVVRGDMSLVGPRPLPVAYLSRYTPEEGRRHEVRPGITGWAQVNGRNALSWEDRLALDLWYVDHRSFALDVRILARTVGQVLRREGITAQGDVAMGELRPHLAGDDAAARAWTRDRT